MKKNYFIYFNLKKIKFNIILINKVWNKLKNIIIKKIVLFFSK